MPRMSRLIRGLLALVIVAIIASAAVVMVAVFRGGSTPADESPAVAASPTPADTPAKPPAAPARPTRRPARHPSPSARPAAPESESETEEAPAPEPAAAPEATQPRFMVLGGGDGTMVVTGGGSMHMTIGPGAMGAGQGMVPMARVVRSMGLDEGQLAAVQKFEDAFKSTVETRLEADQKAMEAAGEQMRRAQESGDQRLIAQATQQMGQAASSRAKTMDELNAEYAQGVRRYLTAEQTDRLDKALKTKTPAVFGYATSTGDGGKASIQVQMQETAESDQPPADNEAP